MERDANQPAKCTCDKERDQFGDLYEPCEFCQSQQPTTAPASPSARERATVCANALFYAPNESQIDHIAEHLEAHAARRAKAPHNIEILKCVDCGKLALAVDDRRITTHKCSGSWTSVLNEVWQEQ